MDNVQKPGIQTTEFFVLAVLSTALVLLSPMVGYPMDPANINMLLLMYTGYAGLRGGQKIATVMKTPKEGNPT